MVCTNQALHAGGRATTPNTGVNGDSAENVRLRSTFRITKGTADPLLRRHQKLDTRKSPHTANRPADFVTRFFCASFSDSG